MEEYRDPRAVLLEIASMDRQELATKMSMPLADALAERRLGDQAVLPYVAQKLPVQVDMGHTRAIHRTSMSLAPSSTKTAAPPCRTASTKRWSSWPLPEIQRPRHCTTSHCDCWRGSHWRLGAGRSREGRRCQPSTRVLRRKGTTRALLVMQVPLFRAASKPKDLETIERIWQDVRSERGQFFGAVDREFAGSHEPASQ
ncbi:hypothetical protein SAMN02745126_04496 [Enhydrobacter aerosaccus]|uniref:Uncharacterized protein n=1 Tax=Enhydrobacter aerosaccus TaxID=225324 RepID=A0A1T4SA00_9HYPH|nr:hypothetical protein SAMN02745126_04496 [Enhydrobacter aerosaccus]